MRRFLLNSISLIAFVIISGSGVYAQENNNMDEFSYETVSEQTSTNQTESDTSSVQLALIANNQQYVLITASLFAFSLIIITLLMRSTPHQAKDLITIIGLISVIFGTILLVLVVDTTETLTAPMGILGAIAGYLFGTAQKIEISK